MDFAGGAAYETAEVYAAPAPCPPAGGAVELSVPLPEQPAGASITFFGAVDPATSEPQTVRASLAIERPIKFEPVVVVR